MKYIDTCKLSPPETFPPPVITLLHDDVRYVCDAPTTIIHFHILTDEEAPWPDWLPPRDKYGRRIRDEPPGPPEPED